MNHKKLILLLCCLPLLLLPFEGCATDVEKRFVPKPVDARQAVETALSTWKSGVAHGTISSSSSIVRLDVFDARWQVEKKKLESYTILEEITGQALPQFKVRLKLVGKPEEMTTYLVRGIDPLEVWREVDYNASMGTTPKGM